MQLQHSATWKRISVALLLIIFFFLLPFSWLPSRPRNVPAQCQFIRDSLEQRLAGLHSRDESDRYVPGTRPVLLRNATLWTGANKGTDIVYGSDVLLDKGLIVALGSIPPQLERLKNLDIVDLHGNWVSPGIVDAHSHLGVGSSPRLSGAMDSNSHKAPILPWLRSIDGLNTHDLAYRFSISGGVTTAQIVPGSANNIGGQSFLIKLRPTAERSTSSMLLEPPHTLFLNGSDGRPRWRHMKHACGENTLRVHSQTRMDAAWQFRQAYNEARKIKDAQDTFCAAAENGLWDGKTPYPESLQWEALVEVLRGHVKVSVHCYEPVDLDSLIRLSNEFKFPIASIHHATSTYLVPDLIKQAWGAPPAIALFASDYRPKRETYRTSEFAARILADHGLSVVIKSDHAVTNSRFLMFEAQQAHYHSLDPAVALSSVTTNAAAALGVGWRVGKIAEGYDADLVIWDSHPLALGSTPVQVYIDGIAQIEAPAISRKSEAFQRAPRTPDWEKEINVTLQFDGIPPLEGRSMAGAVRFVNVKSMWTRNGYGLEQRFDDVANATGTVVIRGGKVLCFSTAESCPGFDSYGEEVVDLQGGSLGPGLISFGSNLGLSEIAIEPSTMDGPVFDILTSQIPSILGHAVIRAVDGLQFGGRHALLAYHSVVTTGITAPMGRGFTHGVSAAFDLGVSGALARGAILQTETALHIAISSTLPASVSTQIAALRTLLFREDGPWLRVRRAEIPLVVEVHSADIMATLLKLKAEYDAGAALPLRLTFTGALEAHLLAPEIGKANVSVIVAPGRPFPGTWEMRRSLPGPPLTSETSFTVLLKNNVNVGIGIINEYDARNARFDMSMVSLNSDGDINHAQALAMGSTNIELALGLDPATPGMDELVAYRGGEIFDMESKVVGVVSARRGRVVLF
ncbi:composite domain of metallo-dependent hydrolase [Mycena capillaripes]|nr:composite domain of metallo-dependent hydrolase [Mycena capillaripes]